MLEQSLPCLCWLEEDLSYEYLFRILHFSILKLAIVKKYICNYSIYFLEDKTPVVCIWKNEHSYFIFLTFYNFMPTACTIS